MRNLLLLIIFITLPSMSFAQFYRCEVESGAVFFSDYPCSDDATTIKESEHQVNIFKSPPSGERSDLDVRQDIKPLQQYQEIDPRKAQHSSLRPNRNHIDIRYNTLVRDVKNLMSSTREDTENELLLKKMLTEIEAKRSRAHSAQTLSSHATDINIRFNTLARETKSSIKTYSSKWDRRNAARRLIKIEAERDAALYGFADDSPKASTATADSHKGTDSSTRSRPSSMPAPQTPSIITSCDPSGCWDNLGNRYNKGAGNTYFGPSGACQMIGGMMQCP